MYSIIICFVIYFLILLLFVRFQVRGGNAFEYGSNLIFVSRNLLKSKSKLHKLFKNPNTLWNQHLKQIAWMRLISLLLFPLSLICSIVSITLLNTNNGLSLIFDYIALGILALNLISIFILVILICIEGAKANKVLDKISSEEYQTFKGRILKEYPNFWTPIKK